MTTRLSNQHFLNCLKVAKKQILFIVIIVIVLIIQIAIVTKYKKIYIKKNFSVSKHIIMVNFRTEELKLITEKRGIKNYQNMSRKKLLSTLDKSECNSKNITLKKLNRIAKMQNLSQNELEQIPRIKNLPQNELEQIAEKKRH